MKVVLVILVLMGIGGYLLYDSVVSAPSPNEQCTAAMEAIQPGMSWTEVADVFLPPKRYQVMVAKMEQIGDVEIEVIKPTYWVDFTPEVLTEQLEEGRLPHGFNFEYICSASMAFSVHFDGEAKVKHLGRIGTMADMLEGW